MYFPTKIGSSNSSGESLSCKKKHSPRFAYAPDQPVAGWKVSRTPSQHPFCHCINLISLQVETEDYSHKPVMRQPHRSCTGPPGDRNLPIGLATIEKKCNDMTRNEWQASGLRVCGYPTWSCLVTVWMLFQMVEVLKLNEIDILNYGIRGRFIAIFWWMFKERGDRRDTSYQDGSHQVKDTWTSFVFHPWCSKGHWDETISRAEHSDVHGNPCICHNRLLSTCWWLWPSHVSTHHPFSIWQKFQQADRYP